MDELEDDSLSYRKVASRNNISLSTLHYHCARSKHNKGGIYSYKLGPNKQLSERLCILRKKFCNEFIGHDWKNTCFIDECDVQLFYRPNRQNSRDRRRLNSTVPRRTYSSCVGNPKFGVLLGINYHEKLPLIIFSKRRKKKA